MFRATGVARHTHCEDFRPGDLSVHECSGIRGFQPASGSGSGSGEVRIGSYPHVLAIHDRFTLEGSGFQGAADSNHVYLNDDPCLVVASSPVSLVVLPGPRVAVGDINLHITVAGMDAGNFPVSAVMLEFSGPAEAVNAGSSGKLILHAHGSALPLLLEVRNGSPQVIQLSERKRAAHQDVRRRREYRAGRSEICDRRKLLRFGSAHIRRCRPARSGISQKASRRGAKNRVRRLARADRSGPSENRSGAAGFAADSR